MAVIFLVLLGLLSALIGSQLYGLSPVRQVQSGVFFGLTLGCVLIIIFGGVL